MFVASLTTRIPRWPGGGQREILAWSRWVVLVLPPSFLLNLILLALLLCFYVLRFTALCCELYWFGKLFRCSPPLVRLFWPKRWWLRHFVGSGEDPHDRNGISGASGSGRITACNPSWNPAAPAVNRTSCAQDNISGDRTWRTRRLETHWASSMHPLLSYDTPCLLRAFLVVCSSAFGQYFLRMLVMRSYS